jgi:uncharacterized protein YjaG (DUF416 family)
MADTTPDNSVLSHITKLTEKEEQLYGKDLLSDEEIKELHKVKIELDQYWDLLRQRRALREVGENPNQAELRSGDTVENYEE